MAKNILTNNAISELITKIKTHVADQLTAAKASAESGYTGAVTISFVDNQAHDSANTSIDDTDDTTILYSKYKDSTTNCYNYQFGDFASVCGVNSKASFDISIDFYSLIDKGTFGSSADECTEKMQEVASYFNKIVACEMSDAGVLTIYTCSDEDIMALGLNSMLMLRFNSMYSSDATLEVLDEKDY